MDCPSSFPRGKNPYQTTIRALAPISPAELEGKKVLLKPNAARLAFPGQGITTHPLVVKATLDFLGEIGIKRCRHWRELHFWGGCSRGLSDEQG